MTSRRLRAAPTLKQAPHKEPKDEFLNKTSYQALVAAPTLAMAAARCPGVGVSMPAAPKGVAPNWPMAGVAPPNMGVAPTAGVASQRERLPVAGVSDGPASAYMEQGRTAG